MINKKLPCSSCRNLVIANLCINSIEQYYYCKKCKNILEYKQLTPQDFEMAVDKIRSQLLETLKDYPEFMNSKHLVELGLFTSLQQYSIAKQKDKLPPHIIMHTKRLLFPKVGLIEWLVQKCTSQLQD